MSEPGDGIAVLKAGAPLGKRGTGSSSRRFSLVSYNVLLPNSQDGWWVYKYYGRRTPMEARTWAARQQLFRAYFEQVAADIVCIQEASADSFEDDFGFMRELGYDHELHRKFRFRSATFWRRDKFQLQATAHKDRTLITALQGCDGDSGEALYVVNCHLSGGSQPERRFGQVHQALDQVRKEVVKSSKAGGDKGAAGCGPDFSSVPVVVCGDFNSEAAEGGGTAWQALLRDGELEANFRELLYPDTKITSKRKAQVFGRFTDVYAAAFEERSEKAPPTYIAAPLDGKFLENGFEERRAGGTLTLSEPLLAALTSMFCRFSGVDLPCEGARMEKAGVEEWLRTVNGEVGRGSEFRSAMGCFERNGEEALSLLDFVDIYRSELAEGKYWGVQHDLVACDADFAPPMREPPEAPFQAALDGVHINASALRAVAIQEPLPTEQLDAALHHGDFPPNTWHPSDHLPLAVMLERIGSRDQSS